MNRLMGKFARMSFVTAALVFLFAAAGRFSLSAAPPPEENIVLRGTVVSSVDGAPIRTALVQVLGEMPRAMLTGADGSFQFEGMGAGDAVIVARKPGYFSAQEYYPESVGEQRVHLTPNLQPLEMKLYPEAVIYGRVTNENGRALEGFTVELTRTGAKHSTGMRGNLPSAITNENGEFRLAELHAGSYLVNVSQKMDADGPIALFQASKLRTGYPTYFYPSVTDPSLATPVRLTPGKQVQADMRLTSQPLYRLSGSVLGATSGGPLVVVVVGRHDVRPVAATTILPGLTSFVLEGVPAGSYFVGAVEPPEAGVGGTKTGISEVEVAQNVDSVSIVLSEDRKIPVRFRYQFAQAAGNPALDSGGLVSFLRTDLPVDNELFAATLTARPDSPEEGYEVSLQPGTYHARVRVEPNRCVVSVKSGTSDVLNGDLIVTAGGSVEPIEVVLRDDCARVQGTVSKGGQPSMGRVLLIPEDGPRRGISAAANSDGVFQFQGLAPGKYLAVALDGTDDLDPEDPETLAKVKSQATPVEVQASGAASLTLELKSLEP